MGAIEEYFIVEMAYRGGWYKELAYSGAEHTFSTVDEAKTFATRDANRGLTYRIVKVTREVVSQEKGG